MEFGLNVPVVDTIPVLGVPVTFRCADPAVTKAIGETFGTWHTLIDDALVDQVAVTVSIVVTDGTEGDARPIPFTYHMLDATRFFVRTPGSFGVADRDRGDAIAYVSRTLVKQAGSFRLAMLEGLTLLLVAARDRQPLHAALIRRGPVALVLAAPTGTGKSSLAYAAADAGWELLSDDAVYVQLGPPSRVWGRPGVAYLPEDTAHRFPMLRARRAEPLPNGKVKVRVPLPPPVGGPPVATHVGMCLLGPSSNRGVTVERVGEDQLADFLCEGLGPQRMIYARTLEPAARWVAARGGWRIGLSDDPRDAVAILDDLATQVARPSTSA